jgi:hypothetical protein
MPCSTRSRPSRGPSSSSDPSRREPDRGRGARRPALVPP